MRIIAGTAKGRILQSLKGLETRPTLERVREAVFNILGTAIRDAQVLDLFAGSGAFGLEALSRGAASCVFNDRNKAACRIIKENINKCSFPQPTMVLSMDAFKCLSYLKKKGIYRFDVIYIDPPYKSENYPLLFQYLLEADLLNKDALIIVESDKKANFEEIYRSAQNPHFIRLIKNNKYGDTVIWFYKYWGEE